MADRGSNGDVRAKKHQEAHPRDNEAVRKIYSGLNMQLSKINIAKTNVIMSK